MTRVGTYDYDLSMTKTKRLATGLYVTPEGHRIENVAGMLGVIPELPWRLTDPQGDWMGDHATKADALASLTD